MADFVLMTDSSCDLPDSIAQEFGILVMPLRVNLNGTEFHDYLDEHELPSKDLYKALREGGNAVTSAVNPGEFLEFMEPVVKEGKDLLYIAFASALSSTYQNGVTAAEELKSKYPGRRIYVLDSRCASMGQGLLVYLTALEKRKGKSLEELRMFVRKTAPRVVHWFTVDDLFFLQRGGRVSAASAAVGTLLNVKPVLHVDREGRLINMAKAKGRRAAIKYIFDKCEKTGDKISEQIVFISHGDCIEDAKYLEAMIRDKLSPKDVVISNIGPVIGAHSGPGTLAVFFLGDTR